MAYRPKDVKERIIHRLKIASGQLGKVISMIENDDYCIDIIHQSQAIQKAMKEADMLILEEHLKGCVSNAVKEGKQDDAIKEVINVFRKRE